jgi:hypothetical protein
MPRIKKDTDDSMITEILQTDKASNEELPYEDHLQRLVQDWVDGKITYRQLTSQIPDPDTSRTKDLFLKLFHRRQVK